MIITMPKLGLTMTEATLTRWLKAAGAEVKQGEILFEFESDKSIMEYESPADGRLAEHLIQPGETVPCGTPVAHLETMSNEQLTINKEPSSTPQPYHRPILPPSPLPTLQPSNPRATPVAKRRARELGLDLGHITGRGPAGRIHLADVEAAAMSFTTAPSPLPPFPPSSPPPLPSSTLQPPRRAEPLTGLRRVIAGRMSQSAFTAPHVTLFTEADATNLVTARAQINAELAAASIKISYNTLFVPIVARLLAEHPYLNACLMNEVIQLYQEINIALAVDTGRGLIAPVIRRADRLNLVEIQRQAETLIERALNGQNTPDDTAGGTFTLTNLGSFEIDGFTPIINQPQAAILGIGRIVAKPVVLQNEIKVRHMLTLSLSFDHRLVDGGPAAQFLQRVKQLIERPFALMLPTKL
jgi:pyruvate dehydrogenase E2 component (dihydrolipoamide acetyltransferase)